eukprot:TRINITY_DN15956_c1_g2_i1.p1 TRINITY_DN15956_c1_g2~~TRINITY_DN15956_c1_g2_i1.p1  ORF type:complete len:171 (+),score=51.35 TRINITY_DN15956_c1_g2_i1:213-725(+)
MKPDWDQLIAEFATSKTALVADVDCTAAGEELCTEANIEGYPTIKWGRPDALEDYDGERDLASLQEFARENLGPQCSPANLDLCNEEKKKQIEEYTAMGNLKLQEIIAAKELELAELDAEFEKKSEELNEMYAKMEADTQKKKKAIKSGGLGMMRIVSAHLGGGESHPEL